MKIVVIKDMSAGNAETGEAWQETKIFDSGDSIQDILDWAIGDDLSKVHYSRKRIQLTVPDIYENRNNVLKERGIE